MPFDSTTVALRRANFPASGSSRGPGRLRAVDTRLVRHAYLPRRATLVLDDAEGAVIAVDRGCLWVTLESDLRDIILARGMRFQVDRSGRTVIAAEEDSRLRIIGAPAPGAGIAAWLRRAGRSVSRRWSRELASKPVPYY